MIIHKPDGSSDHVDAFYIDVSSKCWRIGDSHIFNTQGYNKRKAFVVAPELMQSTATGFWRMVWENKSHTIVILGQLKEDEEEMILGKGTYHMFLEGVV